ncbi:MAG TPA: 7,8-didemethyl-8-hydroxy-5-deazariboflavin synthase CofG [Blastocatellia bacterium]|nr:7,8-didemethyl-8-hydroxy-5-deazariboflavin synthase CofG [Blastocatellia bacterium]
MNPQVDKWTELERGLRRGLAGEIMTTDEARALTAASGATASAVLRAAREVRERAKGRVVTFSKKIFIPLTNLCRDYCGYCTFRRDPGQPGARTMTPDEVLELAAAGAKLGCKEALFSLGDKPEVIFPEMRETLRRLGHRSTLSYLIEMCGRVLNETGLLPHANPGLMTRQVLERLRPFNASAGLMVESVSRRLCSPGAAHDRAPDKLPDRRLQTIAEAGRLRMPFTTGLLIGIGETAAERADSLLAIRELHERYGHIQEVIIQNFRAKPEIPMRNHPEPDPQEFLLTIAAARLILGPEINLQAPPNLSAKDYAALLDAGLNDWGGISPLTIDHINPEAPWPQIEALRERTAAAGFTLRERLSIYPEFIRNPGFIHEALLPRIAALADSEGYAIA